MLAATLLCGRGAAAHPPHELTGLLTDRAAVLTDTDGAQVRRALDDLAQERGIRLHVVYVDSFDGLTGEQWADQTFVRSALGEGDVVLAVAVADRVYGYREDTTVSTSWADQVATDQVQPHLSDGRWAQAALAAAEGYRRDGPSVVRWVVGGIAAAAVVVAGAAWVALRIRGRRTRRRQEVELGDLRAALSSSLLTLEDLVGSAREMGRSADADLGEVEAGRLRQSAEEGAGVADAASSVLQAPARRPLRRPPRGSPDPPDARQQLDEARAQVDRSASTLRRGIERARRTLALQADPTVLALLRERHEDLVRRAHEARHGLQEDELQHPDWLRRLLLELVTEADRRAGALRGLVEDATDLLHGGAPAEAGERWAVAEATGDEAADLLAAVADPDGVAQYAHHQLRPEVDALSDLVAQGAHELARHDHYRRRSGRVGSAQEWSSRDAADLMGALERARAALAAPPALSSDPHARGERLRALTQDLEEQLAPYRRMAAALAAADPREPDGGSVLPPTSSSPSSSSSSGGGRF